MLAAMTLTMWMCGLVQDGQADAPPPAATEAPAAQPENAAAPTTSDAAPTAPAPPREKEVKMIGKTPRPPRAWWSTLGIIGGLGGAAIAAAVFVGGVGTQIFAFWCWYDQTNADRPYAQREFATNRARIVQWIALGLLLGGAASFFGGLIGATYAFGLGNPDPKTVKDL